MPFDPKLYPKNWDTKKPDAIRNRILARAKNCCERCGKPLRLYVDVGLIRRGPQVDGYWRDPFTNEWFDQDGHLDIDYKPTGIKSIRVVLTIAHVHDMDPMACDDDNLAAWCQRCHNVHDIEHRKANRARTNRRKAGEPDPDS